MAFQWSWMQFSKDNNQARLFGHQLRVAASDLMNALSLRGDGVQSGACPVSSVPRQ